MASAADKGFLAKKIISSDGPKGGEVVHDATLGEWCLTRIEPEEESNRRRSVLERIVNVVRVWIRHTMITEFRMPEAAAAQVEGRIFATGSYRYNVHTSGSDIDMVLIAPSRITREHFFNSLAPRLKSEPWVTDLHCIRESRVPIIAMMCDGIDIDLSFGSIRQDRVPEVITDDLLQGLDEQSVLSCNAVRVAHNIMDLVPNKAVFRQALRFVKAWGKARAIYSNTFGFPSGIGWAILTAFVCQCYPNQNAAGMITRFFRTYHTWFKPNPHETGTENRAIYLTESTRARSHLGRGWDPRESKSDAMALFPVLTPAVPYGNACYNVTLTNLRQLCVEFQRGHELLSQHLGLSEAEAKARFGPFGVWSSVLEPVPFFGKYQHYLHMKVSCSDAELYQAYADGVESRMRILWSGNASSRGHTLEDYRQLRLHLNPRRFEDPDEVELRARMTSKAAGAGSVAGPRGSVGPRSSGQLNADTHAKSLRDGVAAKHDASSSTTPSSASAGATAAAAGPTWFTAHYFIGMTVDTKVSSAKIDLMPAIRTFHTVVRELRQYREGITKLPAITVVDMTRIPAFVKEAAGYVEAAEEQQHDLEEPTEATAAATQQEAERRLNEAKKETPSMSGGRDGDDGGSGGAVGGFSASSSTSSPAPAPSNGHHSEHETASSLSAATTTTAAAAAAHTTGGTSSSSTAAQSAAEDNHPSSSAVASTTAGQGRSHPGSSTAVSAEAAEALRKRPRAEDGQHNGASVTAKTEATTTAVAPAAVAAAAKKNDDDDLDVALGLDF
ncbi:putative Poly(A) polymerase [Leptomonas pyrrhocoris]|uniref:Poly(A) polymerase n=1 Tax=Leptomonas pyrrhocoris TaxID=157538 RepID=A0A0N0VE39_LEPPY|nr:putative Poly(A) polymerase [Leptomonas pyrrhocoris]KPA77328.1 putative Poly(A) polymerase [Leptomonas pyrrhocoris]|eukprot:XP_015655767.1 putative Poly(A) polymerase [Leptomonas pyrrhocoris]